MKFSRVALTATTLAGGLISLPALAHTGSATVHESLFSGLLHPVTGIDHLLAMLALGIWAAQQQGSLRIQIPAVFTLMLLAGFAAGVSGLGLPMVESATATSVLVLGLLAASAARLSATPALLISALFALCHGFAHGAESAAASATLFAAGFLGSSFILQISGAFAAHTVKAQLPVLVKLSGLAIAATGASLLAV
jgi:urease accessory protein